MSKPSRIGQISRLRLALAVAVVGLIGAVPSVASAQDASLELAERYAPVVRLVAQEEPCAHGEPYTPSDVNLILGNEDVALRGPWDRTNIIKVGPTGDDLASGLFDYHLDLPGTATNPGCVYDEWSHRISEGTTPRTYARVVSDPAYPEQLALQYWFFYLFNDFNDKHEGDWEMVQLNFDARSADEALTKKPALVGFSQHEGAESAAWGDEKLELVDGTHPVVYPALGSHANYYSSALHLGRSAAQGVGCDDTSGPSTELRPAVSLIPTDEAAYLHAYPWLGFQGHWGEEHQGFYNGPTGPATKLQWTEPITWANEEWRDKSFVVPGGTSFGSTATGFFCGAVATGSGLLTSLVGNPSPVLIALAVLVLLILWLTSQTSWQPSAPLRLERRRSWGSVVTAARRMYFGHVRLFLGIGLLFFPLGILISGVQYLLFRAAGLDGLVESAGETNAVVGFLAIILGVLFTIFGFSIVQSATAIAMAEIDAGRETTAIEAYRRVLPRLRPLLGAVFVAAVVLVIVGLTTIGVLLGTWLLVRWAFLPQVIVLEGCSARAAFRRSGRLVRGNWWRVASLLLFVAGVTLLLGPLLGTLLLFVSSASFNFVNFVSSVVYAAVLPYAAIAITYLYYDRRVEKQHEESSAEVSDVLPGESPQAAVSAGS